MFVSSNAKEMILSKRKSQTLKRMVVEIVMEAERLNVSKEELIQMIQDTNTGEAEK